MHRFLLSALTFGLLTVPFVQPMAQESSDSAKVQALEVKLMDSYKQRQIDFLASLLDEDVVITF